jgi:hypothetical protein
MISLCIIIMIIRMRSTNKLVYYKIFSTLVPPSRPRAISFPCPSHHSAHRLISPLGVIRHTGTRTHLFAFRDYCRAESDLSFMDAARRLLLLLLLFILPLLVLLLLLLLLLLSLFLRDGRYLSSSPPRPHYDFHF